MKNSMIFDLKSIEDTFSLAILNRKHEPNAYRVNMGITVHMFSLSFASVVKGEVKNHMELQLALKVCQEDLAKAQEELKAIKAEYWDVIPRDNWDTLEQTHKQTLLQVCMLHMDTQTHLQFMHAFKSI